MKNNKKNKLIFLVIILLLIFSVMIYFYINPFQDKVDNVSNSNNRITTVTKQTIRKEISGSGEINSNLQEKLSPKKNRYLKEVYVEENQIVKKGEKILKYTNGTYLTAPYDLAIKSLNLGKIGKLCNPDYEYIEVLDIKHLIVTLNIDESDKNSISVGQEVNIKANAFENKEYKGKVKKIDAIGKYETTGSSFKIIIEFENDGKLSVGMSAFCQITVAEAKDALVVPIEAVKTIGDQKFVTIVNEDGTTKETKVETGLSNDIYVEIKSGLELGQKIQYISISKNGNNSSGIVQSMSTQIIGL